MRVLVSSEKFDPAEELSAFMQGIDNDGAVVSFTGHVRGGETDALILSHYPGLTENRMKEFGIEAEERFDIRSWIIRHRVGEMKPGEAIVFVATAAAHRRAAFEAADFIMDKLKTQAPLWKQERRGDNTEWIEPRDTDYSDAKRWTDRAENGKDCE